MTAATVGLFEAEFPLSPSVAGAPGGGARVTACRHLSEVRAAPRSASPPLVGSRSAYDEHRGLG